MTEVLGKRCETIKRKIEPNRHGARLKQKGGMRDSRKVKGRKTTESPYPVKLRSLLVVFKSKVRHICEH